MDRCSLRPPPPGLGSKRAGIARALSSLLLVPIAAAHLCAQGAKAIEPDPSDTGRLERLERENREIRERLHLLESRRDGSPENARGEDEEAEETGIVARYGKLRITFQVFSAIGFELNTNPEPGTAGTSFAFGNIDIFTTAQLSEHFQVASETGIEGEADSIGIDQERLYGVFTLDDSFYAKAGLEHTTLSRWNRLYHHGKWLETTIERPLMARFEDDGGFIPMHFMGVELGGRRATAIGTFWYAGILSNGRGPSPDDRQRVADLNPGKALEGNLGFQPSGAPGFQLGGSFRYEDVPGDALPANPAPDHGTRQFIASTYLQYHTQLRQSPLDIIAEGITMNDRDNASGHSSQHYSAYLQIAYALPPSLVKDLHLTPYTRFDFADMANGDPFLAPGEVDQDRWEQLFGLRYDFCEHAALKFEFRFGRLEEMAKNEREWFTVVATQLAWYF